MKNFLFTLIHPRFWINIYPVNKSWDKWMNDALDKEAPVENTHLTVKLAGKIIWVGNYPYAFGSEHGKSLEVLPNSLTRKRLFDAIIKERTKSL